jgi:hypothetical protein
MNTPFDRTWLVTSAFCKSELLKDLLAHVYKTPPHNVFHVILDNHYPIDKLENSKSIKRLAHEYDCTYIDNGKDLGLHGSLNNTIKTLGIKSNDLFICLDPDDRPTPGFCDAMRDVMSIDDTIGMLGLNFSVIEMKFEKSKHWYESKQVDNYNVWYHKTLEMINVCAYRMSMVLTANGFQELFEYYGGIESALYPYMKMLGLKLAYLSEYRSDKPWVDRNNPLFFDREYRQWKDDHITNQFRGSFEEWLKR